MKITVKRTNFNEPASFETYSIFEAVSYAIESGWDTVVWDGSRHILSHGVIGGTRTMTGAAREAVKFYRSLVRPILRETDPETNYREGRSELIARIKAAVASALKTTKESM